MNPQQQQMLRDLSQNPSNWLNYDEAERAALKRAVAPSQWWPEQVLVAV
jgi:hypothetical protein